MNMKTGKFCRSILFIGISLLTLHTVKAQPDPARMEKDIDVFEKVVNELFRNQDGWPGHDRGSASGTYVPGYGVIMHMPAVYFQVFSMNNWNVEAEVERAMELSRKAMDDSRLALEDSKRSVNGSKKAMKDAQRSIKVTEEKHGRKIQREEIIIEDGAPAPYVPPVPPIPPSYPVIKDDFITTPHGKGSYSYTDNTRNIDSVRQKKKQFIEEKMRLALQSYGDLLTQLGPNEKILLVYDERSSGGSGSQNNVYAVYSYNGHSSVTTSSSGAPRSFPKISAEVKKEDLNALRSGKLNAKTFSERVKMETMQQKDEDFLEYKIFSGILETVFNHSEDVAFRIRGNVTFTYLSGFGVIYQARMRASSSREMDELMSGGAGKKEDLKNDKRLDDMERELKSQVLDYGRTLRSLKDDQFILLNIDLPDDEEHVSAMSIRVKKEVLTRYEKGEINRDAAMKEIVVTRSAADE